MHEEISITPFKNDKDLRRITPRRRADLPENVAGAAHWMQPDVSPSGRQQPPSYHAISPIDRLYYPVEYINDRWFWLEWDDSDKYFGYWVHQTGLMEQGYAGLGWDR